VGFFISNRSQARLSEPGEIKKTARRSLAAGFDELNVGR
jgi:hypothetical protein